jgi:AbrB family looped-hinge helix DNA binding protein
VTELVQEDDGGSCNAITDAASCCKIESIVSVDDRGQMVLPKDIRDKAGIHAGDKLALICWERGGEVCCISLIKVDGLADGVRGILGPVMKDIIQEYKEDYED